MTRAVAAVGAGPAQGRAIRLGIAGCGRATVALHLPALASVPGIEVAALADPDPAALGKGAALARSARAYPDWQDLAADPTLDAVAVCTPTASHAGIALSALDAGKHVFVEKPLALTLADCDRLVERAARAGVHATVGFNTRWHAQARRARDAIARGGIGAVDVIASRLTSFHAESPAWQATRAGGGGVLMELAIHHVDLWRWLTGLEIVEVAAYARAGRNEDESATVVARMENGALASAVFASRTSRTNDVMVCGSSGSVAVSLYRFDGFEAAAANTVAGDPRARIRAALALARELPHALRDARDGGAWPVTYRDEWRAFAASIRGEGTPGPTLDDGRRSLAVVLAAIESAATGRSVRVAGSPA